MSHLPLSYRLQPKWELTANSYILCPGQDIILYCKFIKETLQYRWCTIQGFIPSPALSAHTQASLTARCRGGAVKPLPLLSSSNGKGSTALTQCHQRWEDEDRW